MKDYQIKRLKKYRKREVFSFLGIIWTGYDFHWSGVLCGTVSIIEEKVQERHVFFNEWNYQNCWSEWLTKWDLIKIESV